jgi:hypothetical protein
MELLLDMIHFVLMAFDSQLLGIPKCVPRDNVSHLTCRLMPDSALTAPKEKKLTGRQYFESGRHAVVRYPRLEVFWKKSTSLSELEHISPPTYENRFFTP